MFSWGMQFRYKGYEEFGALKRPIIQVTLRNPRETTAPVIAYEALVDSGSDRNIFPAELASIIGIDLTETENVRDISGVVASEQRRVYFHPIEIMLGGRDAPSLLTQVGFMTDFTNIGYGLLGRRGFFNQFSFVKFKEIDSTIDIGKLRS
jgi:hypothetical protein